MSDIKAATTAETIKTQKMMQAAATRKDNERP